MKYVGLIAGYLIGLTLLYGVALISVGIIRVLAIVFAVMLTVIYLLKLKAMLTRSLDPESTDE